VPKDEEVNIGNIPVGSTIKIMNLRGKILNTMKNENYTEYQWDGRDRNGKYVNSGVYIVTSSHPDYKTVVGKLAIIRER
jgi:flagellar hook assembly protein FlgD